MHRVKVLVSSGLCSNSCSSHSKWASVLHYTVETTQLKLSTKSAHQKRESQTQIRIHTHKDNYRTNVFVVERTRQLIFSIPSGFTPGSEVRMWRVEYSKKECFTYVSHRAYHWLPRVHSPQKTSTLDCQCSLSQAPLSPETEGTKVRDKNATTL